MSTPVLLHSCCAPCSAAILEWLTAHDYAPTVFFCNPNIFPREEYDVRKNECVRYCKSLGIPFLDADYDHALWRDTVKGLENEPERGARCRVCFGIRLEATAMTAERLGIELFTTTLAGSRWKRLDQIREAGQEAAARHPGTTYWDKDWKKGGLQERRSVLLKENGFYNQLWCGCEFSIGHLVRKAPEELPEYIRRTVDVLRLKA